MEYERYLREEADRRARYFEQKAQLVDMYDPKGQQPPGVREEMKERLSPIKTKNIRDANKGMCRFAIKRCLFVIFQVEFCSSL